MRNKFFGFIARLATNHPLKIVAFAIALTLVSTIYATFTLKLNANLDDLVSEKLEYHKRYIDFLKEFGDEEYLYVVVDSGGNMPEAKKFVEAVGARIKRIPDLKQVIYKIENPALEKNFLLYMTPDQISALRTMLAEGPFAAKNIARWDRFSELIGALATRISKPVSAEDEQALTKGFTFIDDLLGDMTRALEGRDGYKTHLQEIFFGDGETFDADGFYRNGDLLFVMIMPAKDFSTLEVIEKPLDDIRRAIAETKREYPTIDAGLTGRPVLAADEIMTSDRDMTRATIIAIILVSIICILFFRSASRPLLAMFSLIMGISWTFGLVAVIFGILNILSIVFAIILVGAAIEYAIHIVARYQEELAESGDVESSIARSLATAGKANLTSAFTTAAAFCTIMWTDFTALAQLGFIAASGVILCLISMLIVLPAMLVIRDRRRAPRDLKVVRPFSMPYIGVIYRRPWILFAVAVLISIVIIPFAFRTGFDNNLMDLQAQGLESVKFEHLIIEKSGETTWFARAIANTIPESHEKARAFEKLKTVRRVDDIERILPENQEESIEVVRQFAPAFKNLKFSEATERVNERKLMYQLGRLQAALGLLQDKAFSGGRVDAVEELGKFGERVRKVADLMDAATPVCIAMLGELQKGFFEDLHKHLEILASGMNPTTIALEDLPPDLVGRFKSPKGRYGLFIYPKENIWDPVALEKFVDDIRSVDPNSLGTPIEVHESGRLMRNTFAKSAILAFLVICILVWIDFRSWRGVVLAVMPLVVGTLWLLGFMGLFGIPFNMANFFAVPILIGIGVDFGVHLLHRLKSERSFHAVGTSTGKGMLLTAIANAVGFGAMMLAAHRGIASLGEIMAIGALCCLAAAFIAMPVVAKWLNWGRDRDR